MLRSHHKNQSYLPPITLERKKGLCGRFRHPEKIKFYCLLFNFEVANSDPKNLAEIHEPQGRNSFNQLDFIGDSILTTIPSAKLKEHEDFFFKYFLNHIADIYFDRLDNLPV